MTTAIGIFIGVVGTIYFFYLPINFFFPSLFADKISCHTCKYHGKAKMNLPGSGGTEVLLLILGIFPGVAYAIWRQFNKYPSCPKCNAQHGVEKVTA